jgi:hypothetical protein
MGGAYNKLSNIMVYLIIAFIIFMCIKIYFDSEHYNLKCIISSVDGEKYCVRERSKIKSAVNLLAKATERCSILVNYMKEKYPHDEAVEKLYTNYNPSKISETLPTSEFTAYSENKGEKLAFCLNKKKEDDTKLIDLNTLTFVAIHELSHIMTKEEGHKLIFWQNFKFLLENAKDAKIYIPEDYKKKNKEYCGMTITDNPYYDLE